MAVSQGYMKDAESTSHCMAFS